MKNSYYNDNIFFVADKGWQYVTPSRFGILNPKNGNIIWEKQLKKTGGLPEAPKIKENTIFIRTTTKTLYMFELDNLRIKVPGYNIR